MKIRLKFFQTILLLMLGGSVGWGQKTIQIYHGAGGETQFFEVVNNYPRSINNHEIKCKNGENITFEIINPNQLIYKYDITSRAIKEKEAKELYEEALTFLTLLNSLSGTKSPPTITGITDGSRTGSSNSGTGGVAVEDGSESDNTGFYINKELAYELDFLSQANSKFFKKILSESDEPKPLQTHVTNPSASEIRTSMIKIKKHVIGFSSNYNKHISKKIAEGDKYFVDDTDPEKLIFKVLRSVAVKMKTSIESLESSYGGNSIQYKYSLGKKITEKTKINLSVSKLNKDYVNQRDIGDSIRTVTISPVYKRNRFELVPVVAMLHNPAALEFSLQDGLITSQSDKSVSFSPGMLLNWNFIPFGEYKESSVGFAAGLQLSSKSENLVNLNIGPMISYKNVFRLGFGIGSSQSPVGVEGASVGDPLPADIPSLDDALLYESQFTYFINLNILGLSIGL